MQKKGAKRFWELVADRIVVSKANVKLLGFLVHSLMTVHINYKPYLL